MNRRIAKAQLSSYKASLLADPPKKRKLTFFYLLNLYPVFHGVTSLLPIRDIIALTRTCRGLSKTYQYMLPVQWNIDRTLQRFVNDPCEFRSQMGRHNALVSGSLALQFFERVVWNDSDMDVFITKGDGATEFSRYICRRENYLYNESKTSAKIYPEDDISQVWTFHRAAPNAARRTRIQIIQTQSIPVQAILRSFYATNVVNIITWNKAYAIFPKPTFLEHKCLMLKTMGEFMGALLSKYSRRGWRTQDVMYIEDDPTRSSFRMHRRVGDRYTWTIPFDTKAVSWSTTPDTVIEYCQFRIFPSIPSHTDRAVLGYYTIVATGFVACTLKYVYTYGSVGWADFLGARMNRLTHLEILKMPPSQRPKNYPTLSMVIPTPLHLLLGTFQKPSGWTDWDDAVPRWHAAWEQLRTSGLDRDVFAHTILHCMN